MAAVIVRHPAVVGLDRSRCDGLFAAILRDQPLLLNILLTDANGSLKGTGVEPKANLGTVIALPYIKDVVASRKPLISELTTGQVSGKPTVILAYPVFREDEVVGALGLGVNLTALQSVFMSIPLPEGSVITVTDSTSRVLARSRDPERYIGTAVESRAVPPSEVAATQMRTGPDGVPRFYGNSLIARGPWIISVGLPTSVVADRLAPLWRPKLR